MGEHKRKAPRPAAAPETTSSQRAEAVVEARRARIVGVDPLHMDSRQVRRSKVVLPSRKTAKAREREAAKEKAVIARREAALRRHGRDPSRAAEGAVVERKGAPA